jgi:putative PEP-CTERM system TPR-repeat lipoprotein
MNYKKALLPILISAVLSGGLSGCSKDKTAEEYINSAQVFLQQGKNAEAIISLKNLLKNDLNNAEGRFLLGKSYAHQGNWSAAEKELNRAQKYNYNHQLLYPLLANVYSHLEDSSGIELLLKEVVHDKELEQSLKYFLGVIYISEGDEFRALSEFTDVVDLDADSPYGQLSQVFLYSLRDKFDEAIVIVNTIIEKKLDTAVAIEVKAKILFMANEMEQAAEQFNLYLKLRTQDHQNRLLYAVSLANALNFSEADKQADLLMKIYPNNSLLNLIKAQSRLVKEDYIGAKQFAELALNNTDDKIGAIIIAGYSSYKLDQPEMAHSYLKKIKNKLSLQHPARRLFAALSLELGYIDESYESIKNAPYDDLDVAFLSQASSQLFKGGNLEKADYLLDKAKKIEPVSGLLAYQKGVLKMAVNDPESISFFEQAIKSNPELEQAISLLVMEYIKQKRFDEAFKVARSVANNNIVLSKTLEGVTYKIKGELTLAERAFKEVLNNDQENTLALFNLGNIEENNNNITAAVDLYQKVLMVENDNAATINAFYRIGSTAKHNALINERLIELVKNKEYSPNESIILVGFYMNDNKIAQAKLVLNKSLEKNPENFLLRFVEAKSLVFEGNDELALEKLDQMIFMFPNSLQARKLKVAIFNASKKSFDTIQEQEAIVKLGLGEENEILNLAFLYIQNNNLEKANLLLSKHPNLSNTSSKYNVVMGRLAFLEKKYIQAIFYLKPAYEGRPTAPILIELVQAMQKSNQTDEALALILGFEEGNELTIELMLKKAELYTLKEPNKALVIYKNLANKTNNHYVILNNIAYVLLLQKELTTALSYSKKALSKAENNPAIINTYGLIQLETGNFYEAIKYLSQAYTADVNNHNYLVHYIQALHADKQYGLVDSLLLKVDKKMLSSDSLARLATISFK